MASQRHSEDNASWVLVVLFVPSSAEHLTARRHSQTSSWLDNPPKITAIGGRGFRGKLGRFELIGSVFWRFLLCELTATFNIGSKKVFFQVLRWWFGEFAVHETTIQHNNGVYAFWAPFWWNLWWSELIADTIWWFWQSELTAPFILAENAFLGERVLTVIQKWIQNRSQKIRFRTNVPFCDAILRIAARNDTHWTTNDPRFPMRKKSARNSLWKPL